MITAGAVHSLELPQHLHDYLSTIGGQALLGPKYRMVWSGNEVVVADRKWTWSEPGSNGEKIWKSFYGVESSLKYKQPARRERWIIEKYRPPFGDPHSWTIATSQFVDGHRVFPAGPFPSRGSYHYVDTVETVDADGTRGFLWPTEAYLDTVVVMADVLLDTPEEEVTDAALKRDAQKKEFNYNAILERVKTETDPLFRSPHAAFNNLSALEGSGDYLARNASVASL